MSIRDFIQYLTAAVTLITIIVLVGMVRERILSWRYVMLPLLVSVQLMLFYAVVFFMDQPPTETVTMWSAIIRLETGLAFLIVLLAYWKAHLKQNG